MILNNKLGLKVNPATSEDLASLKAVMEVIQAGTVSEDGQKTILSVLQLLSTDAKQDAMITALASLLADRQAHPSGVPALLYDYFARPNNTITYIANGAIQPATDTAVARILAGASIATNGGGFINDLRIETNIKEFAGQTIRVYLFKAQPSNVLGDNQSFILNWANSEKRIGRGYVDVTFDPLEPGSDMLIGPAQVNMEYNLLDGNIYYLMRNGSNQIVNTGTLAQGIFRLFANVIKMS